MNEINMSFLNPVKNRFLSLPRSAVECLEHEPTINDFEIIKELGIGSFGSVYLANHKKTKAQYAIKAIDKNVPENLEEKTNFNREVEIMYKLNHPNIVKLYGHFEDSNYCYFIMQYIPKRSVFEIIPRPREKPNLKLIASVMKDLLSAVYYLHNMKPIIIHRDIKPENILLDENSKAYLTDFGWSNYKINDRRRNTVCGTPVYLPPEMVGQFGHDETADIWCIGVLLFELITGITPFQGNDFETVKYNISKLRISWPNGMDPDAKDLCSKILKLNSKDRLPIEQILNHKFFNQFFPNAVNELIKPESQKNKIFVVSKDDPKTWIQQNKHNSSNSIPFSSYNKNNNNENNTVNFKNNIKNQNNINKNINSNLKYKKISYNNKNKEISGTKAKAVYIPRANIDLSKSTINERDKQNKINNNKISVNSRFSNYRNNTTNNSYNKHNSSNINNSFTGSNNDNKNNRYKNTIINAFNSNNKYRNSYKSTSINNTSYNSNYSSSNKYRKSFNNNNFIKISSNTNMNNPTNYNKNFMHSNTHNYNNTNYKNISMHKSQNNTFYTSYNYKK